jgi:hypothetical protein
MDFLVREMTNLALNFTQKRRAFHLPNDGKVVGFGEWFAGFLPLASVAVLELRVVLKEAINTDKTPQWHPHAFCLVPCEIKRWF